LTLSRYENPESAPAEAWVIDSTTSALERMKEHVALVEIGNTDEATFRTFFIEALKRRYPTARLETEWRRFDLLVRFDDSNVLIEFKYYLARPTLDLDGRHIGWKGGAGAQNERELRQCLQKLHECIHAPIHARYLVLVYQAKTHQRKDYTASYGSLGPNEQYEVRLSIDSDLFGCKVLHMR
jgi:hypothetical protein